MNNVKSLPKRKLIAFLNFYKEAKEGEDFSFSVNIPPEEALNFVHRMRVELSRFREKVRARARTPKHFKMLFIGVKPIGNEKNKCEITLRRSQSGHDVSNVVDEIFEELAGGKKLDV